MVILGIDPGTKRIGYGIIKSAAGKEEFIAAGLLKIESADNSGALKETKKQVERLIKEFRPEIMAVEKLYFMKNQKTAMSVAEARGAIILSGLENGLAIREYGPNEVKAGVTGYGLADKKAVLKMVKLILGKPSLKIIDDASDALAIAILAGQRGGIDA
jgi:crossover junction endodeoxyribonuclease RuvC